MSRVPGYVPIIAFIAVFIIVGWIIIAAIWDTDESRSETVFPSPTAQIGTNPGGSTN